MITFLSRQLGTVSAVRMLARSLSSHQLNPVTVLGSMCTFRGLTAMVATSVSSDHPVFVTSQPSVAVSKSIADVHLSTSQGGYELHGLSDSRTFHGIGTLIYLRGNYLHPVPWPLISIYRCNGSHCDSLNRSVRTLSSSLRH